MLMMMCQTPKVFDGRNERFRRKIIGNDVEIAENRTFGIHTSNTNKQRKVISRRNRENHIGISIETSIEPVMERESHVCIMTVHLAFLLGRGSSRRIYGEVV